MNARPDKTSFDAQNERFLKILSAYLNFYETVVSLEDLKKVAAAGVSEERAFSLLLAEALGVDAYGADRAFYENYFVPSIKKLEVADYYADEYYETIKFTGAKSGAAELKYKECKPCQGFVRDDFEYLPDGRVLPKIGFFTEVYRYPAALADGREWMTLLPNEINSQKEFVGAAFGKVLTYGLGLGYYVFRSALKKSVSSVTVVDLDKNVIKLFEENILPQFPPEARAKVKIVNADALKFGKTLKNGDFDYVYADIWHDAGDGVPLYLKLKENEKYMPTAKYGYWIEKTMKHYLP